MEDGLPGWETPHRFPPLRPKGVPAEKHIRPDDQGRNRPHTTQHTAAQPGLPSLAIRAVPFFLLNLREPHLLPTAPAIVRPANTPPLVVADMRSGFYNDLFFSDRFELEKLELFL